MRVAVVFPGQGTQQPGMGVPWQDHPAWKIVEQAEAALGEPLAPLLIDAPAEQLARTREAQLAVLCTSLSRGRRRSPTCTTSSRLPATRSGQVTALIASGVITLDDGVRFAARRAELTQAAADAHPGRMAALLGATVEQAEAACDAAPDACWIANDNAPGQIVIAGTPDGLDAALGARQGARRAARDAAQRRRRVPHPADARRRARHRSKSSTTCRSTTPARPSSRITTARAYDDADGWRARLPAHVTVPVRWRESMETLAGLGATTFVEVGHGSMIAGVAKRTVPDVTVVGCATPEDVNKARRGAPS